MKESMYKHYDELPLFLNAELVAKVLGVSPSTGYELIHEPDFPVLKVGSRMVWCLTKSTTSSCPTVPSRSTATCSTSRIGKLTSATPGTRPSARPQV